MAPLSIIASSCAADWRTAEQQKSEMSFPSLLPLSRRVVTELRPQSIDASTRLAPLAAEHGEGRWPAYRRYRHAPAAAERELDEPLAEDTIEDDAM